MTGPLWRNVCLGLALLGCTGARSADLIEYHEDRAGWEAAVGTHSTADFLGFPEGPFEPDIYGHLGMLIVEPPGSSYGVNCCSLGSFPRDGAGINGAGPLELVFAQPIFGMALDFNGLYIATTWLGSVELETTSLFGMSGHGNFGGFISTVAFDRVVLVEPAKHTTLSIDDIHFGPPIPAPAAGWLLLVAWMPRRRRRWREACGGSWGVSDRTTPMDSVR